MYALTLFEIRKALSQSKCLLGVFAIAIINALFVLGFFMTKNDKRLCKMLGTELFEEIFNACCYLQTILYPCSMILFPVVMAVIVSYILAGEHEIGILRLTMVRPHSRSGILLAKFCAAGVYAAIMLVGLFAISFVVSCIFMKPSGELIVLGEAFDIKQKFIVHAAGFETWFRIGLSYVFVWPMLLSVACLAFFFSAITRNFALSAILSSTIYLASYIVGMIPFLAGIHPYLPTRYMPFWKNLMFNDIPWGKLASDAAWMFAFSFLLLVIAALAYEREDF